MEVRVSRASAIIVQRVPRAAVDRFVEWHRGIAQAAAGFDGYQGEDIYAPTGDQSDEWVVALHFENEETLQRWLTSPVRKQWLEKIQADMGAARLMTLHGGFAAWFAGRVQGSDSPSPPGWKIALTVLLGLYPTVMLLVLYFPGPYLQSQGMAVSMLIGNALSVALLQWAVMPALNTALGPWLRADPKRQFVLWIGGLVLILVLLGALAVLFHHLSG